MTQAVVQGVQPHWSREPLETAQETIDCVSGLHMVKKRLNSHARAAKQGGRGMTFGLRSQPIP